MTGAADERQSWELDEDAEVPTTSEPIREEERGELGESDRRAGEEAAPGADPNESATSDQSPEDEGGAPG
jgi:hypothetical protein